MAGYKDVSTEDHEERKENLNNVGTDSELSPWMNRKNTEIKLSAPMLPNGSRRATMKINLPGERGNLFFAVFAAAIGAVALGSHCSWASPSIPKLQSNDSWLPLTNDEVSWVVSLEFFGIMFGPFIGSLLVNNVGRRGSILIGVIFNCVAWTIIYLTTAPWHLCVGRLTAGLGLGIEYLACPMYTAEISEPAVRGALGSIFAFFLVGGYLPGYIFGPYVTYHELVLINMLFTILFLMVFPLVPESPYYLLRKGRTVEALESLTWLRKNRDPALVQKEIDVIQEELRKSMEEKAKFSDLFATRGARLAMAHSLVIVIFQQLSGIDVIMSYAEKIFIMSGAEFSASVSALLLGLVLFVSSGFAGPLVGWFGMKNVLIASGFGMFVCQIALGAYFYGQTKNWNLSSFNLLPVSSLVCFICFFTVGFGVLAWAVVAEVFPPRAKPLAPAICTFANKFTAFVLIKFFLQASDYVGTHTCFFFFAVCCLVAGIYVMMLLPDTRNLTLQEIQDVLEGRRKTEPKESYELTSC